MGEDVIEKIAQNSLLQAVSRVAMVLASAALPMFFGFLNSQAEAVASIDGRVTIIEPKLSLDQAAQGKFQADTEAALRELQVSNTRILQNLATLIERTGAK